VCTYIHEYLGFICTIVRRAPGIIGIGATAFKKVVAKSYAGRTRQWLERDGSSIYICICICVHTFVYTHFHICMYAYICLWIYAWMYPWIYSCINVFTYVYIFIYLCMYACMQAWYIRTLDICTHTYMYMYICDVFICDKGIWAYEYIQIFGKAAHPKMLTE